jgi:hypothetical protein
MNQNIDGFGSTTALSSASKAVSSLLKDSLEDADSLASRMLHRLHSRVVNAAQTRDDPMARLIELDTARENKMQYSMCVSNDALQEVSSCCSDSPSSQAIDLRTPEQELAASHDSFNVADSKFPQQREPAHDVETGKREQEIIVLLT